MDDRALWSHLKQENWVNFDQLDQAIRNQALLKGQGEFSSLGELLVQDQALSREKLAQALRNIQQEKVLFEERESLVAGEAESFRARIPKEFDKFLIEEQIGQGGMGIIYKAVQKDLKRVVALKVLRPDLQNNLEQMHRLHREAKAVAKLNHPNIITIYDTGIYQELPYFTMEYINGPSVETLLQEGKLDLYEGLEMMEAIARALAYAHARGVFHRDIKPSNILIGQDNIAKLTDFGLAKNLDSHSLITHTGEIVGTVSYMSPEQAQGSREMDGRSDIYSLGIMLYQICCGRLPFQGETTVEILRKITEDDPIPPRRLCPDLPWPIETITLKALEKDPSLRYQHAEELADDMRRFLEGEVIQARPFTVLNQVKRKLERHKGYVFLALIGGILILSLIIERHFSKLKLIKIQTETRKNLIKSQRDAVAFEAIMFLEKGQPQKALYTLNKILKVDPKAPYLLYLRGKTHQKLGENRLAVQDFSRALSLNSQLIEVLFVRAETYRDLKEYKKSLEDYSQFLRKKPKFDHGLTNRAEVFCILGKYEEAIEDLQTALGLNPTYFKNYYLLGLAYLGIQKPRQAIKNFGLALKYGAVSPSIQFYLAKSMTMIGSVEKAKKIYSLLLGHSRREIQIQAGFELAKLFRQEENLWEAIEILNQVLEWDPKHRTARILKAKSLVEIGEFHQGVLQFEKILAFSEKMALRNKVELAKLWSFEGKDKKALRLLRSSPQEGARLICARIFLRQGQMDKAEKLVKRLLGENAKLAEAYALRGQILFRKREFSRALQAFNLASYLGSRDPVIYAQRGHCYLNLNQESKARENFKKADFYSLDARADWARFFQMGLEAEKKLVPDQACKMYSYALFLNPGFSRAYYRMAYCLSRTWQGTEVRGVLRKKAIFYYKKTLEYNPYFFPAYEKLAQLYLMNREYNLTTSLIRQAFQLGGESPELYLHLGRALWKQKKIDRARINFNKVIKKKPSLYRVYSYLSAISKAEGRTKEADKFRKLYQKYSNKNQLFYEKLYLKNLAQYQKKLYLKALNQSTYLLHNYPRAHRAYILRAKIRLELALQKKNRLLSPPSSLKSRRTKLIRQLLQIGMDYAHGTDIYPGHFHFFFRSPYEERLRMIYGLFSRKTLLSFFVAPLQGFPEEGEVYFLKGIFYFYLLERGLAKQGDVQKAIGALDRALQLKPRFSAAWSLLGYFYTVQGKDKKAVFSLKRAISLAPSMGESYYFLACFYSKKGKILKAISLLHQALDHGFKAYKKLENHPYLKGVRSDPNWKVLQKKMEEPYVDEKK